MKKTARAPVELVAAPDTVEAQARALDALALGQGAQDAAEAAGVPLGELLTWATADADFIAAMNRRRRLAVMLRCDQVRYLAARAVEALAAGLDDPAPAVRIKAAEALLRANEALGAPSWGPETAEAVREMWADAEAERTRDRRMRDLLGGL